MAQQKISIAIPPDYGPEERSAIGNEIVDRIIERTRKENVDWEGKPFPKYSKSYSKSFEFQVAGKGSDVDLTLTGEMLDELKVLSHKRGTIEIGYDAGDGNLNGKVEGNRIGSYGGDPSSSKARDFLGIQDDELNSILEKYPFDLLETSSERARSIGIATSRARDIASNSSIFTDEED